MTDLTQDQKHGLGVAFNEATLLGAEVSPEQQTCAITVSLLTLPESGPAPEDSRIQILLRPVGKVWASLRLGRWDDDAAPVQRFEMPELLKVVQSFGGPIYGWEFLDLEEDRFKNWSGRLSLDWTGNPEGMKHSIFLFQEGAVPERILDLRIWFRDIEFRTPQGQVVTIDDVIAGGKRWWDGLYAGDKRTDGHGIVPGKKE